MNLLQLKSFVRENANHYPHLKDEIYDLYELCLDEIEQGESVAHEIELCINSIEQLIEEDGKN